MTIRLKKNRASARLILNDDDLLIAEILPPSNNVHIAKLVVSQTGEVEFGEWTTGAENDYVHKEGALSSDEVEALSAALSRLGDAQRSIALDRLDCDLGEYERAERTTLRFRFEGQETRAFLPNERFFEVYGIAGTVKESLEDAFREALSFLPIGWIKGRK